MPQQTEPPVLIVEMPEAVGFRGQIRSFLAWLRGWPADGQMVAVLGTGTLAGCMPAEPVAGGTREPADPRSDDTGEAKPWI